MLFYAWVYIYKRRKYICITESFKTSISHHLFDYKITFVNQQQENTNSKDDFGQKKTVLNVLFKDLWYTKINPTQIWYYKFS